MAGRARILERPRIDAGRAAVNWILVGVAIYIAVQLALGFAVSRGIRTENDYVLAGRRLGYPLAIFSIFATWFGAETCMGAAGRVYEEGLAGTSADPFGYGMCILLLGLFFAVPLWRRGLTTLADLFEQRYSRRVAHLAAVIMIPTSVIWAGAQLRAFGHVLHSVSDALPLDGWIVIATVVVLTYTVFGGLLADACTDLVQGAFLILGLCILAVVAIGELGGVDAAVAAVDRSRLEVFPADTHWLELVNTWALPIIGSVTAQELIARLLAARNATVARRSALSAAALYMVVGLIPVGLALCAKSLVPELDDPEQFLPVLAQQKLHTLAYVMFIGALISAILSTVDSSLLVAGTLLSHNLVVPHVPGIRESTKVRIARVGVFGFGVLAFWLAIASDGVTALVEEASGFGSAGIFVIFVLGLFAKVGGPRAAVASLLTGVAAWEVVHHAPMLAHSEWLDAHAPDVAERMRGWLAPVESAFVAGDYLITLALAFVAYFAVAAFERARPVSAPVTA
jgi:SSS family transporter